jgi:predicted secreted protein
MAEITGRVVVISIGGNAVATARSKSLTINNEAIDITADGDLGIQRMLDKAGQKSVELSVEGLENLPTTAAGISASLFATALNNGVGSGGSLLKQVQLDYYLTGTPNVANTKPSFSLTGDFFLASYEQGITYNEAVTFSATFNSSSVVAIVFPS